MGIKYYSADTVKALLNQQIKRSRDRFGNLHHKATDQQVSLALSKVRLVTLPAPDMVGNANQELKEKLKQVYDTLNNPDELNNHIFKAIVMLEKLL